MDSNDAAFEGGWAAFDLDVSRGRNPYDAEDFEAEHDSWDDGWLEAKLNAQNATGMSWGEDY